MSAPSAIVEGVRRNRLLGVRDLRQLPRPEPLIKGVLYSDMEHVLFGPQGVSKTFLLLDWCLHMAYGRRWMGRRTDHARSLIVCGEGGGRVLADRIDAWLEYHEISDDLAAHESLRITEYPVQMLEPAQVSDLLITIADAGDGFGLIAIDTLAANFGPGDENATADMTMFCMAMREVRLATKAGVLVVHHTGHADRTRPQGANVLRRNPDIELRVDRDQTDHGLCGLMGGGDLKSRHGAGCGMIPYRLEPVNTGQTDTDGDPITSCVIVPTQDVPNFEGATPSNARKGENQRAMLAALRRVAADTGQDLGDPEGIYVATDQWTTAYKAAGLVKQQAYRVRKAFQDRGWLIEAVGGFKWFPE